MMFSKHLSRLLLVVGLLVMSYPLVATGYKYYQDRTSVRRYESAPLTNAEKEAVREQINAYNKGLEAGKFNARIGQDNDKGVSSYDFFNNGEILGTLLIPAIKEKLPIYFGSGETVLRVGVGLMENTSYPGNNPGHAVITGHRGTYDATIFRHLDRLTIGDVFYIQDKLTVLKYQIIDIKTVEPMEGRLLKLEPEHDLVTLLTCTPYIFNTHRLLVTAERAAFVTGELEGLLEEDAQVLTPDEPSGAAAPVEVLGAIKAPEKDAISLVLDLSWEIQLIAIIMLLVVIAFIITILRSWRHQGVKNA